MRSRLSILCIPIYKGQKRIGVKYSPDYFTNTLFNYSLKNQIKQSITKLGIENLPLSDSLIKTKNYVKNSVKNNFELFIGGDHSISMATISGILDKEKNKDDYVILWLDAHPDCNTFETSSTKNIHGMPIAGLLGLLPSPYNNFKCLKESQIMIIGSRSIDEGEQKFLEKSNVKNLTMSRIKEIGIHKSIEEIKSFIKNKKIHISFDVDCLDPKILSSTGTPVPNGFNEKEIDLILNEVSQNNVKSMDIVEFNPRIGNPQKSFDVLSRILSNFINKVL